MRLNQRVSVSISRKNLLVGVATACSLFGSATAQYDVPDPEICGCAPGTYTFTLDFGLTCPPVNVTRNGGVAATFCQVSPFGDADQNITDLVPVRKKLHDHEGQTQRLVSKSRFASLFLGRCHFCGYS
jgi:hypothetical protein